MFPALTFVTFCFWMSDQEKLFWAAAGERGDWPELLCPLSSRYLSNATVRRLNITSALLFHVFQLHTSVEHSKEILRPYCTIELWSALPNLWGGEGNQTVLSEEEILHLLNVHRVLWVWESSSSGGLDQLPQWKGGFEGGGGSAGSAWPPRGSDASLASFMVWAWLPGVAVAGLTGCPTLQHVWLCVLTGIIKDRPGRLKTLHLPSAFVHCVSFCTPPPLRTN